MSRRPDSIAKFEATCNDIADGLSIKKAAKKNGFSNVTFFAMVGESEEYLNHYARAREERATSIFEEILDIADDASKDTVITDNGIAINSEFVQRSRLRIDVRKWMLGKMQPKKYGDKMDITSAGNEMKSVIINLGNGIDPKNEETQ